MCARRFLAVIFVFTLIIVAGAFAIFQWGGNVLLRKPLPRAISKPRRPAAGPTTPRHRAGLLARQCPMTPRFGFLTAFREAGSRQCGRLLHPPHDLSHRRSLERAASGGRRHGLSHPFVRSKPGKRLQRRRSNLGAALSASRIRRLSAEERRCTRGARSSLSGRLGCLRRVREGGRRQADHPRGPQPGRASSRTPAQRKDRRNAALKADCRGLCRRLADRHRFRPSALGLPACTAPAQTRCILSWMTFGDPANPELILDGLAEDEGARRRRSAKVEHALREPDHGHPERRCTASRTIPARSCRLPTCARRRCSPARSGRAAMTDCFSSTATSRRSGPTCCPATIIMSMIMRSSGARSGAMQSGGWRLGGADHY